ncbi:hypothetical protein MHBO_002005 [Bonamia ostreae]|uniref:Uncharacterized protein n=1 Tax=Bonamia ostreae TaxID=126728 RepID=A0ABV2AKY7_9EUKA
MLRFCAENKVWTENKTFEFFGSILLEAQKDICFAGVHIYKLLIVLLEEGIEMPLTLIAVLVENCMSGVDKIGPVEFKTIALCQKFLLLASEKVLFCRFLH